MTSKSDEGKYSYDGSLGNSYANPNAVTSIGDIDYRYDRNGNLIEITRGLSNTWDYSNRLLRTQSGGATIIYAYDHTGQRVKYSNGSETTIYSSKSYNVSETKATKHLFAGDQMVATVEGGGTAANIYSIHTDHLSGSSVISNELGTLEEVTDYYPFGGIRLNEKAGTFTEQRKFTGHEYDQDTDLTYMNARYYSGKVGRFISQDPVFLEVGSRRFSERFPTNWRYINNTALQFRYLNYISLKEENNDSRGDLQYYLINPQNMNSYSYVINNPLKYIDPDGETYRDAARVIFNFAKESTKEFVKNSFVSGLKGSFITYKLGFRELAYFKGGFKGGIKAGAKTNIAHALSDAAIESILNKIEGPRNEVLILSDIPYLGPIFFRTWRTER